MSRKVVCAMPKPDNSIGSCAQVGLASKSAMRSLPTSDLNTNVSNPAPPFEMPAHSSVVLDWNQRRATVIRRQNLEQHVHHWCVGLVENGMIDVTGLKKEVTRCIHLRLGRQDVRHVARCHLSDTGPDMIVLADMTAGRERQFGDAELVFAIDLVEKAA